MSILLFIVAKDAALQERGYSAVGGEYLLLTLPALYYIIERVVKDWIADIKSPYKKGYADGYRDCSIITGPQYVNGHTAEFYAETKFKYETAIYTISPTDYQKGYGEGFDKRADEYLKKKAADA
jgi:hypothetical protein